jgi:hypothetical protein
MRQPGARPAQVVVSAVRISPATTSTSEILPVELAGCVHVTDEFVHAASTAGHATTQVAGGGRTAQPTSRPSRTPDRSNHINKHDQQILSNSMEDCGS